MSDRVKSILSLLSDAIPCEAHPQRQKAMLDAHEHITSMQPEEREGRCSCEDDPFEWDEESQAWSSCQCMFNDFPAKFSGPDLPRYCCHCGDELCEGGIARRHADTMRVDIIIKIAQSKLSIHDGAGWGEARIATYPHDPDPSGRWVIAGIYSPRSEYGTRVRATNPRAAIDDAAQHLVQRGEGEGEGGEKGDEET